MKTTRLALAVLAVGLLGATWEITGNVEERVVVEPDGGVEAPGMIVQGSADGGVLFVTPEEV